ncbi:MAG: DUF2357 domain-containing protein [Clostridia bacterium]|nr:DUF2357 domain-containing protein [Clostridia bacterium]
MDQQNGTPRKNDNMFRSVYDDSIYFIDSIIQEYNIFPTILDKMRQGDATIELRKRFLLRAIDETWVNIIEDTLPALDVIIRNPSKFIEEKEEVVPVELSRKVTVRTLQHLSQHTNYISRIDGDMIIPSKLLNVYRDETLLTYENKFVNTLINRLYAFVNRRYEIAKNAGQDEKTTSIEFKDDFDHNSVKVKMNFRLEIAEPSSGVDDRVERNYSYTTDLWHRVERLNDIVTNYANSEFVREMGHAFIRPPVMRTNAILKNKNLRQCLTLWQFIESYDSAGYSMLVQEDLENVDDNYVKELYSTLALQYMIFRYNIHNEFDAENTLASELSSSELKPRIIDEIKDISASEYDLKDPPPERVSAAPAQTRYATLTPEDMLLLESIDVALDASDTIRGNGEEFIYDGGHIPEPEPEPEPENDENDNASGDVTEDEQTIE